MNESLGFADLFNGDVFLQFILYAKGQRSLSRLDAFVACKEISSVGGLVQDDLTWAALDLEASKLKGLL